ncbi:transmembrane protein [Holotrichia oblita]|uniref:Transmembrane protein n=1 Tax=Holotrichia oblita TaxID=644536 RepID=A0ACB9TPE6_HOLOL|nr:transmembrane protein [Holotrichia oblita]
MSGQWEVVSKKKDKNNKQPVQKINNIKDNKKKSVIADTKVEDVLPQSQIKSLFGKNKENQKQEKVEKNKKVETQAKKPQKKIEKQPEPIKPKPPKSIESALNSINVEDFKNKFETTKTLFPDAHLLWLKELAQFLNQKVTIEVIDPTFKNKAECFPYSAIPIPIRNVMEKAVKEAGKENVQVFYDISLQAMATDMSKGLPALGHKLFIQLLVLGDPKIVIPNLSKHITLRNSYQNRQAIGLSILWAVGQAGIKDFNIGFKVFQDIMLPIIEMKNYSRYVITYLIDLINRFNDIPITKEQYLSVMDTIYSNKKNVPADLTQSLQNTVPKLKLLLFTNNSDKYNSFIEPLLKNLAINENISYRNEICDVIITSLQKDHTCFGTWNKNYTKTLPSSAILLNYMDTHWKQIYKKFNRKIFKELLNTYLITNEDLLTKKRKDDGLIESTEAIKKIRNRMSSKKSVSFPFKTLAVLLLLGAGLFVLYDIKQQGSWEKSKTLKGLQDSGIYEYMNKAGNRAKQGSLWIHQHIDNKFPGYADKIVEVVGPYVQLIRDLALIWWNIMNNIKDLIIEKYPSVLKSIDSYAPGLIEQSSKTVYNVWSSSVLYINRSVDYLKREVFV